MGKPLKLLIVEDSAEDTELLGLHLKRAGYEPGLVRVEKLAALESALGEPGWDAILCDYHVPGLTVFQVLELVRARGLDIPFLVVSGAMMDDEVVAVMRAGAHDFVMKDKLVRLGPALEREMGDCAVRAQRRALEAQMQQRQKLESLGLLAGGIAHDFNNLLTGILASASLLQQNIPPEHEDYEILEQIVQSSERAALLTRQLLAYSGRGKFVVDHVDVSAITREAASLMRGSLPSNADLQLDLTEGLPPVEADPGQLQQLLTDLVVNGCEALGNARGHVRIATGATHVDERYVARHCAGDGIAPGLYVTLDVSDSGSGIEQSILDRIFDPFFTTKFMGRGLGLAAAQGIVRGHHGAIVVQSEPGRGSTFRILLPAAAFAEHAAEPAAPAVSRALAGTVLVVDDQAVVRESAETLLRRKGMTVLTAENGRQGVDTFRKFADTIDVVLLDLTMPVMDGQQALDDLRKIRPDVRVLLSSGYDESDARRRFEGKHFSGFLQKPYNSARLVEAVARCLTPWAVKAGG